MARQIEGASPPLFYEMVQALLHRLLAPLRILWRRSWMYRLRLRGKMPGAIDVSPNDFSPRDLGEADALLRGRFRFAGESVEVEQGSVFERPAPSERWLEGLHGFVWLAALSTAGGPAARHLATELTGEWVRRNAHYSEPAWRADVLGRRLINIFAHSRFLLSDADVMWRSKLLVSLREQSRMLARISEEAPEGLPRLAAATGHALSGLCLDDSPGRFASGLERLEQELAVQILPDGGHISRSPEALLCASQLLASVIGALEKSGRTVPERLAELRARMFPMLRFFRAGDGALSLFNGGREGNARCIAALLSQDEVRGLPLAFASDSGFQRLAAGRALLIMDCGRIPHGSASSTAHAGCLSFEFSTGSQRLVVNCGDAPGEARWGGALRATAAHSTITIADRTMARMLSGRMADLLGPRLISGPENVASNRLETDSGWMVEAAHDGYRSLFGIVHERRVTLSRDGRRLIGADRLLPKEPRGGREPLPLAARFHIHPDVRVSSSQGGGAILKLPSGDGWRFQATGGELSIEKSIYLGSETARNCEQLVLSGQVRNETVDLHWVFERIATE